MLYKQYIFGLEFPDPVTGLYAIISIVWEIPKQCILRSAYLSKSTTSNLILTALAAEQDGVDVFKNKAWRKRGQPIPEVLEAYRSVGADLNVLPFCSQFIPMDVINFPTHKSICYHPSILPLHRGASAINW